MRRTRRYLGPARRWQGVTALAVPQAARRRIDPGGGWPTKKGSDRAGEQAEAARAARRAPAHVDLWHQPAGIAVQREPFGRREAMAGFLRAQAVSETLFTVMGVVKSTISFPSKIGSLTEIQTWSSMRRCTAADRNRGVLRCFLPFPESAFGATSPVSCFRPWSARGRHIMRGQWVLACRSPGACSTLRAAPANVRHRRDRVPAKGHRRIGIIPIQFGVGSACGRANRWAGSTAGRHAAAGRAGCVVWNFVPSLHIRCGTTASRRATATTARFMPRRLATCMPRALSQLLAWEW